MIDSTIQYILSVFFNPFGFLMLLNSNVLDLFYNYTNFKTKQFIDNENNYVHVNKFLSKRLMIMYLIDYLIYLLIYFSLCLYPLSNIFKLISIFCGILTTILSFILALYDNCFRNTQNPLRSGSTETASEQELFLTKKMNNNTPNRSIHNKTVH